MATTGEPLLPQMGGPADVSSEGGTVDALMKLDLAAGVEVQISLG